MLTLTISDDVYYQRPLYQSMQVPFIETCGNALGHEQPEYARNFGLMSTLGIGNPSRMFTLTISDDLKYHDRSTKAYRYPLLRHVAMLWVTSNPNTPVIMV